ncbi:DUF1461 domain-containing protein [Halothiobacillus sp. DCM-1]|uniref:lipoprotein intramolecular transacylase Lit n=1 Tax=Halothiobacillus sp. DCM-1 TaxID=3112558 RepID=UPI003245E011
MPRIVRSVMDWLVPLLLLWPAALGLAWVLLSQVNFFYPLNYRLLDIGATINQYTPQNHFGKQSFVETDLAERERLFAAITTAINHHGQGLAELKYHNPSGQVLGDFLTPAEVQHLTDVARVVRVGEGISVAAFLLWLLWLGFVAWQHKPLPSLRHAVVGTLVLLGFGGLLVAIIGPIRVFDWFHRSVFPANHAWFFYYQDSLMTTFMQAPNLFGLIVLWWLLLSITLVLGLWWIAAYGLQRRAVKASTIH